MKSVQLNQTINFLYNQVFSITTRVLIQAALVNYYATNQTPDATFPAAYNDFQAAIGTQSTTLEGRVYTNNFTRLTNLTFSTVGYPFPDSLFPDTIPPTPPGDNRNTSAGQVSGPVAVPQSPGTYALSFTIPIVNSNTSSTPLILGYMSMVVSASGLLRAVNDSTGMGETGQTLVIARNDSEYQIILPPLRTPDLFEQSFNLSQSPAAEAAFQNQTGFLIDTHNSLGTAVSVGYTVPSLSTAN
jgi:osomolarity two-component system, sensor histidine kinase SLN1